MIEKEKAEFTEQELIYEMHNSGKFTEVLEELPSGLDYISEDMVMKDPISKTIGLTFDIERYLNNFHDGKDLTNFKKEEAEQIIIEVFKNRLQRIIEK